jgi:transposase
MSSEIQVQTVNHLGIIAGLIDEIDLVEQIDQHLGRHPKEIVSAGQVVKAMILNGLGFVSAPLYLFERFFEGKATEHLIGRGVRPEHLNDDRLGRVLDQQDAQPQINYRIQATLERQQEAVQNALASSGRFVLATNVTDSVQLSAELVLLEYKRQQSPERGFRFLQDPLFFTNSVFVKSPERVEAIAFIMGLCLLVYSLGQRTLRSCLVQAGETLNNQLGQPTGRPTLRWVFQCFQDVHLLLVAGVKQIANLTPERVGILRFFGSCCGRYYLLC